MSVTIGVIIYISAMLKKLKESLFKNETQALLIKSKIDKTHDFFHPKSIHQITALIINPKSKSELLNFLTKRLASPNNSLKTKCLIVLHACLRYSFDEELCEFAMNQDLSQKNTAQLEQISYHQKEIYEYVRVNVVDYYLLYIKKVCTYKETFMFVKNYIKNNFAGEGSQRGERQKNLELEIASNGFTVLNLSRFLLQSAQMFNKLGRYHIEYEEIISMYIQILRDLDLFNSYINKSANAIMVEHIKPPSKGYKQISTKELVQLKNKSDVADISSVTMAQQDEKVKHFFLYISECQSVSDRFYQFFHNRYFYKTVRNLVIFPPFLSIKNQEYNRLASKTKKVDKQLVRLVRMSKYGNNSLQRSITRTETSLDYSREKDRTPFKLCFTQCNSLVEKNQKQQFSSFFQDQQEEEQPKRRKIP